MKCLKVSGLLFPHEMLSQPPLGGHTLQASIHRQRPNELCCAETVFQYIPHDSTVFQCIALRSTSILYSNALHTATVFYCMLLYSNILHSAAICQCIALVLLCCAAPFFLIAFKYPTLTMIAMHPARLEVQHSLKCMVV